MSKDAPVKAVWCGPFRAEFADGTYADPGDTVNANPDALKSGHYRKSQAKPDTGKDAD